VTTGISLPDRVLLTVHRHGLLQGGETLLVAVSGGADSTALLDVLCALRPSLRLTLRAVHVHHGLRPEADDDARFVADLCRGLGIPLHVERVTVSRPARAGASPPWQGLEAEARRARYVALRARARAAGAARVATGHTADDQAETVVMRLLEGSGPRGLGGIAPRRGLYIRPLLEARRGEIEHHLHARGLAWVEDASNRDARFLRNRIRHDVLPFLTRGLDPAIVEWLCRGASLIREIVAGHEGRATEALERLGRPTSSGPVFCVEDLRGLPDDLGAEVITLALRRLGQAGPLRGSLQGAIRGLLEPMARCRRVRIGPVTIERSGRWLRAGASPAAVVGPRGWPVPGDLVLDEVGLRLRARCFDRPPGYRPPRDRDTVAFDADRIPPRLTVRGRRGGDRFTPFGAPGERRLKSVLIGAGIPRWERSRLVLLEADGEILWVAGLRRGRAAPVLPETRRILEVTLDSPLAVYRRPE
jgi:tRNA(Ile)-lysidine synthase